MKFLLAKRKLWKYKDRWCFRFEIDATRDFIDAFAVPITKLPEKYILSEYHVIERTIPKVMIVLANIIEKPDALLRAIEALKEE